MHVPVRLGTRGSQLALWQARSVATRLEARGVQAELVIIRTSGDRLQEAPLSEIGGKRMFVKELEDALLRNDIDVAVHSAKDLPAVLPDGLDIAATLPREDARDAIILRASAASGNWASTLMHLGGAPRLGTSSIRRGAQLASILPGAVFVPTRGNVDTRLRKLDAGEYDALVLAVAGMRRLGLAERISAALSVHDCVPAPGQGIIAGEIRQDDGESRRALQSIHDASAGIAFAAEREVVAALGGGCQLPLGALAIVRDSTLELHAVVCSPDGARAVRAHVTGPAADALALGQRAANQLAAEGAGAILDEMRSARGPVEGSY